MSRVVIILVDPHRARGGGQVVLENLSAELRRQGSPHVVCMPADGLAKVQLGRESRTAQPQAGLSRILRGARAYPSVVIVSNANASHVAVLQAASRMRRRGTRVTTVAIIHNYPKNSARRLLLQKVLPSFEVVIVVEPGLINLFAGAEIPSWLSISRADAARLSPDWHGGEFTIPVKPSIKVFARPDPAKGVHLLPAVFARLTAAGLTCSVALGESVTSNMRYSARVRRDLQPWLISGRRGPDWLQPGDVFLLPAIFGEAACLSAQEAMYRGSFIVASRLGLMPYLSPTSLSIKTFASGDIDGAVNQTLAVAAMDPEQRLATCRRGSDLIASRAGTWYTEVARRLGALTES